MLSVRTACIMEPRPSKTSVKCSALSCWMTPCQQPATMLRVVETHVVVRSPRPPCRYTILCRFRPIVERGGTANFSLSPVATRSSCAAVAKCTESGKCVLVLLRLACAHPASAFMLRRCDRQSGPSFVAHIPHSYSYSILWVCGLQIDLCPLYMY